VWTITLASQKGGTGKSTIAIGLAVAAMEDGERVCMLETDPQGTISNWGVRRDNREPAVERITDQFQLERMLRMLVRRSYTLAVIDTPGSDNDITTAAIRLADLCLIPARPSLADIEAAYPTFKAVHRSDRPFAFVLNQAPVRGQRLAHVATGLKEIGALALPYIALRNDHMDSLAGGLGVSEFASDGIAAGEIRALWAWSKHKLTRAAPAEKLAPELAQAAAAIK
jgi:chromosome partitioning protein